VSPAQEIRNEFVLSVQGSVRERLPNKHNPKLATGDIEVKAGELTILNRCPTPPFEVTEFPGEELANEDLRLQYRYLDLRRTSIQRVLMLRHKLCQVIRANLDKQGFYRCRNRRSWAAARPREPRDYLVPAASRQVPGNALPQSPQLYKQILMVAGFDKYFQIARCLRDEGPARRPSARIHAARPRNVVRRDGRYLSRHRKLDADVFKQCIGVDISLPLPRIRYADAMLKYGSDKPDLRYGLEIVDIGPIAQTTAFQVFRGAVDSGGKVRCINVAGAAPKLTRKNLDDLTDFRQALRRAKAAPGLKSRSKSSRARSKSSWSRRFRRICAKP